MVICNSYVKLPEGRGAIYPRSRVRHSPCWSAVLNALTHLTRQRGNIMQHPHLGLSESKVPPIPIDSHHPQKKYVISRFQGLFYRIYIPIYVIIVNTNWLVVKKTSWKMMEFVNGVGMTSHIFLWKKQIFETTNQHFFWKVIQNSMVPNHQTTYGILWLWDDPEGSSPSLLLVNTHLFNDHMLWGYSLKNKPEK